MRQQRKANDEIQDDEDPFSPIQGLWTRSVRPSVEKHDNSLQIQHIDLKLSTHLNKALT
jgi:hypothetical protein